MRKLVCWVRGHHWKVLAHSTRTVTLGHLHHMAGCLAICQRCEGLWNDVPEYVPHAEQMRLIAEWKASQEGDK